MHALCSTSEMLLTGYGAAPHARSQRRALWNRDVRMEMEEEANQSRKSDCTSSFSSFGIFDTISCHHLIVLNAWLPQRIQGGFHGDDLYV